MKKSLYFFLALNYLLLSVGVAKTTHFCMGREIGMAYFFSEPQTCTCSAMLFEPLEGCCEETTELVSIDDDQVPVQYTFDIQSLDVDAGTFSTYYEVPVTLENNRLNYSGLSPPVLESLFKLHGQFIFYG